MRICASNFLESVMPTMAFFLSNIKTRIDQLAQLVFSKLAFLGQYIPALSVNTWALISGALIGSMTIYLLNPSRTLLDMALLISSSALGAFMFYLAFQNIRSADQAIEKSQLLIKCHREWQEVRLSQFAENEDITNALAQQFQDEFSQYNELKQKIYEQCGLHGIEITEIQKRAIPGDEKVTTESQIRDVKSQILDDRFYALMCDLLKYPELPETVSQTIRTIPTWIISGKLESVSKAATESIQEIEHTIKRCKEHHIRVREGWEAYLKEKKVEMQDFATSILGDK